MAVNEHSELSAAHLRDHSSPSLLTRALKDQCKHVRVSGITSATWQQDFSIVLLTGHLHANWLHLSFFFLFEFLNNVTLKNGSRQYVRNKTSTHAEIIFSGFTVQWMTKDGVFFPPLRGSQAHPLLIMKLYKDSIKALNLLPNTERRRIPGGSCCKSHTSMHAVDVQFCS